MELIIEFWKLGPPRACHDRRLVRPISRKVTSAIRILVARPFAPCSTRTAAEELPADEPAPGRAGLLRVALGESRVGSSVEGRDAGPCSAGRCGRAERVGDPPRGTACRVRVR